jgi:hypothetical protein
MELNNFIEIIENKCKEIYGQPNTSENRYKLQRQLNDIVFYHKSIAQLPQDNLAVLERVHVLEGEYSDTLKIELVFVGFDGEHTLTIQ